ncbi:hypothetical protein EDD98_4950 [Streptomyces sp. PanSC19]|uniref:hypothetical protein n=1 Tax=Streptomyces sp. PanSC19 TaxID=1520455 RepID=UPI000FA3DC6D|nr:hypothetical protein [Streptomyces sp. PanSC19]ROQ35871.1 hypothetical protein EDD98_4950 [Streptomyces sp. PanSC19]
MRSSYTPAPSGRPPTPRLSADALRQERLSELREATHRGDRAFLALNAVPLAVGTVLSSFTDVPSVPVYGKLTLGVVWGFLQGTLLVVTAWLHEDRSARLRDPLEQSLTSCLPPVETPVAPLVDESWR